MARNNLNHECFVLKSKLISDGIARVRRNNAMNGLKTDITDKLGRLSARSFLVIERIIAIRYLDAHLESMSFRTEFLILYDSSYQNLTLYFD